MKVVNMSRQIAYWLYLMRTILQDRDLSCLSFFSSATQALVCHTMDVWTAPCAEELLLLQMSPRNSSGDGKA